jgi:hypothetical protein
MELLNGDANTIRCPAFLVPHRRRAPVAASGHLPVAGDNKMGSCCPHLSVAGDEDEGHDSDEDDRIDEILRGGVGGGLEEETGSRNPSTSFCTADGRREMRSTTWPPAPPCQGCRGRNRRLGEPSPAPPRLQWWDPCGGGDGDQWGNQLCTDYGESIGDGCL